MAAFIPPAATLLQASTDYLEQELLPTLTGYHRFQTRISINVLRTVMRELQLAAAQQTSEQARLVALLDHEGDTPTLNRELSEGLADGSIDLDTPGLFDHLQHTLREALAINNPKWIARDTVSK